MARNNLAGVRASPLVNLMVSGKVSLMASGKASLTAKGREPKLMANGRVGRHTASGKDSLMASAEASVEASAEADVASVAVSSKAVASVRVQQGQDQLIGNGAANRRAVAGRAMRHVADSKAARRADSQARVGLLDKDARDSRAVTSRMGGEPDMANHASHANNVSQPSIQRIFNRASRAHPAMRGRQAPRRPRRPLDDDNLGNR